mmetsp:Transcript_43630/g.103704  ORF Transcript_43630/g.103704 Transcript_43630/m.103704 type:complete len:224 (+) Transcript_43630:351-1022(+)
MKTVSGLSWRANTAQTAKMAKMAKTAKTAQMTRMTRIPSNELRIAGSRPHTRRMVAFINLRRRTVADNLWRCAPAGRGPTGWTRISRLPIPRRPTPDSTALDARTDTAASGQPGWTASDLRRWRGVPRASSPPGSSGGSRTRHTRRASRARRCRHVTARRPRRRATTFRSALRSLPPIPMPWAGPRRRRFRCYGERGSTGPARRRGWPSSKMFSFRSRALATF